MCIRDRIAGAQYTPSGPSERVHLSRRTSGDLHRQRALSSIASMVTIDRMLARDSKPKVDGGVVRSLLPASRRTGSAHATGSLDPVLPHAAHPAGMFATIPNHRSGAAHGHM